MTEEKHTPGPWERSELTPRLIIHSKTGDLIAKVSTESPGETEPNIDLIAAAPDLLAALEGVVNDFQEFCIQEGEEMRYPAPIKMAMEAIAKAKGQ